VTDTDLFVLKISAKASVLGISESAAYEYEAPVDHLGSLALANAASSLHLLFQLSGCMRVAYDPAAGVITLTFNNPIPPEERASIERSAKNILKLCA
jgi:hypothetical protein